MDAVGFATIAGTMMAGVGRLYAVLTNRKRHEQPGRGGIFISYRRRGESTLAAGWLYERLTARFGKARVFMDVDTIRPGEDFAEVIAKEVGACDALLVVIGPDWLTIKGKDGRRRLDDPNDFVRLEIEAALKRNVRVIPILIEPARMPRAEQMPADLARLASKQALELRLSKFGSDTHQLIPELESTLADAKAQREAEARAQREAEAKAQREAEAKAQRQRRKWTALAVAATVIVVTATIVRGVVVQGHAPAHTTRPPVITSEPSVTTTEPPATGNPVAAAIKVGVDPLRIAAGAGSIWVTNNSSSSVSRIDPASNRVVATIQVGDGPFDVAAGRRAVWVTNSESKTVSRIDPASNQVVATIPIGGDPTGVAVATGAVWVTHFYRDRVSRIDPASNRVVATIQVGHLPNGIAVDSRAVWVANSSSKSVSRIDPASNRVAATIKVGGTLAGIAVATGVVWVADLIDRHLSRIDPATKRVADTIQIGDDAVSHDAVDVAVDRHAVWVTNNGSDSVSRINR